MSAGIGAFIFAIAYFFLMTFNANLPPALMFSVAVGYFVYTMMGGQSGGGCNGQQGQQGQQGLNQSGGGRRIRFFRH